MRKGETLVGDALSLFLCNVNRIPQSKGGDNKKTSPKATDNNRYAGSFVKRNRRRIIVGREDKSALNTGGTAEGAPEESQRQAGF